MTALTDLTDVTLTSLQVNDFLYSPNGTTWANGAPGVGTGVQAYDVATSKTNVAETRSASINMADNILQRPELKDYSETVASVTAATTTTLDIQTGNVFNMSQDTDITTFSFSNPSASGRCCSFTLIRTKDNTATARNITWPASVKWNNATPPVLTQTAIAIDIFEFFTIDAGTTWFGFIAGQNMS